MKSILSPYLFLFLSFNMLSQKVQHEIETPNFVQENVAFFYKNSWKPFSGSIKVATDYKVEQDSLKVKFENGLAVLQEFTNSKTGKLNLKISTDYKEIKVQQKYDSIHPKPEFHKSEKFTDSSQLRSKRVTNYYYQNKKNNTIQKSNGYIKYDKTKLYFVNGMQVKVEYYYDDTFKKLKESYGIFTTEIGNIAIDSTMDDQPNFLYDGRYQIWNENGKLIEEGVYKEGKKI